MEEKDRGKLTLENFTLPEEEAEKILHRATRYRVKKALELLGPEAMTKNLAELEAEVEKKLVDFEWNAREKLFKEIVQETLDDESVKRLKEIDDRLKDIEEQMVEPRKLIHELDGERNRLKNEASNIRRDAQSEIHYDPRLLEFEAQRTRLQKLRDFIHELQYGRQRRGY